MQGSTAPSQQHHRRQSAVKGPPMLPPGMPVRAKEAQQMYAHPGVYKQSLPQPPPRQPHPNAQRQHERTNQLQFASYRSSSTSSRSPPTLHDSFRGPEGGIRESTRVNIRGSAPPAPSRQVSATMSWESDYKSPREPDLVTPKEQYTTQIHVRDQVDHQFETLLASLQVSDAVRQKFHTVSADVKTSILHSSMTSNPTILSSLGLPVPHDTPQQPKMRKRLSTPLLRKAKSSSSLGSPGASPQVGKTYAVDGDAFTIVASPTTIASSTFSTGPRVQTHRPSNGPRPLSLFGPSGSSGSIPSYGRSGGKGLGIAMGEQPQAFIDWLGAYKGTDLRMEVNRCKKLRMLLRHESTSWVSEFVGLGGYKLILKRLQDLLDVEWREEQHDDQMLYELLRCVKAMSTSDVGRSALRTSFPTPFPALSTLLFSEKKPGDLPSRQIIVELWLFIFDLFPAQARPVGRPTSVRFDHPPSCPVDVCGVVRNLLVPDTPDPTKEYHEFITVAHQPRVFKAWVNELSDICRDYFWIMCHGSNTLWDLDMVDEASVEKPVAPGGATGGVEFEAMNYATTHFKLLNALCKRLADEDRKKASKLHVDLFSSGMDRILITLRKASTTYYPTLHLEIARYVALFKASCQNKKLPVLLDKMVGPPPDAVQKRGMDAGWLNMPQGVPTGGDRRETWVL